MLFVKINFTLNNSHFMTSLWSVFFSTPTYLMYDIREQHRYSVVCNFRLYYYVPY